MEKVHSRISNEREKRRKVAPGSLTLRIDNIDNGPVHGRFMSRALSCKPHAGLLEIVGMADGESVVVAAHVLVYDELPKTEIVRIQLPWSGQATLTCTLDFGEDDVVRALIEYDEGTERLRTLHARTVETRRAELEPSDEEILMMAMSGDRSAYEQIFVRHFRKLTKVLEMWCRGTGADVEQLAIDSLLTALDVCGKEPRKGGYFRAFLWTIAKNKALGERKRQTLEDRRRSIERPEVSDHGSFAQKLDDGLFAEEIWEIVMRDVESTLTEEIHPNYELRGVRMRKLPGSEFTRLRRRLLRLLEIRRSLELPTSLEAVWNQEWRRAVMTIVGDPMGVLFLLWLEGWTYREIAEAAGISETLVRGRIYKARDRLRRALGEKKD